MSIQLVVLKSGEELIADVKEVRKEVSQDVVGYLFNNPLLLEVEPEQEPEVLNEEDTIVEFKPSVRIIFFPWLPLAKTREIPCSADWVTTMAKPKDDVVKLYEEQINGGTKNDKGSVVINE